MGGQHDATAMVDEIVVTLTRGDGSFPLSTEVKGPDPEVWGAAQAGE